MPITYDKKDVAAYNALMDKTEELYQTLTAAGLRGLVDKRTLKKPGYKFAEWELKGVCLRIELGPKDMENQQVKLVPRDKTGREGVNCGWNDLAGKVGEELTNLGKRLYDVAEKNMLDNIQIVRTWKEFLAAIGKGYMALAPSVDTPKVEDSICDATREYFDSPDHDETQELSGKAKALCKPLCRANGVSGAQEGTPDRCLNTHPMFENLEALANCKCIKTGEQATAWVLWGRSY